MSGLKKAMQMLRYAITDRTQYGKTELQRRAGLLAQASRLAAEGIDYIQLREKDLPAQHLIGLAREILNAIRSCTPNAGHSGTRLLINSRADVALAAGADGVHLPSGQDQLTPAQVRRLFGRHSERKFGRHSDPEQREGEESPHFARIATDPKPGGMSPVTSVSCHTLAEVRRAHECGADLILFGPVFGKSIAGKVVVPETGLEALQAACAEAGDTPVLALGGITAANAATTIAVGAKGIAAIRLFR